MRALGRNAPCPCESGRRYKDCCGTLARSVPGERVRALIGAALASYGRDELRDAERLCREALAIDSGALDALHMMGAICYRTGRLWQSYGFVREELERTGWRIRAMRDEFARLLSELLRRNETIGALLSGDEALRLLIESDSRRFADALGSAYSGPATPFGRKVPGGAARVLIIDVDVPVPDRDSGSYRLVAIIGILRSLGCAVTFTAPGVEFGGPAVEALRAMEVDVPCKPDAWSIQHLLAARGREIDVVWVCRYHLAAELLPVIRRCAPHALVVLDTVDLHFLREQREADVTADPGAQVQARAIRDAELATIRDADVTLVVSDTERDMLRELVPSADVRIVSNVHALSAQAPAFAQRRDVLFVGWFKHRPNVDAIEWYVENVWPLVRERLPGARTYVIGADMPEALRNRAADGIEPLGHVPDLQPHMDACRLSIAPLRFGAGVKGKINASHAAGLPVVATSLAVEGMHLEPGRDVLVADSAAAFAEAVVRLHEDEALWRRLADGGRENVARHFSAQAARPVLATLVNDAVARSERYAAAALDARS